MTTDPVRLAWAGAAVALWLLLVLGVVLWRRRAARTSAREADALAGEDPVLVAYASQTGFGEALAWMTARALAQGGVGARVLSFADLTLETLASHRRALFVASTTGEGDAPDPAARFVREAMAAPAPLGGVSWGLLSLGDRSYDRFCGFGRAVEAWLRRSGAEPLFDPVEVDDGDAAAIRHWQHQLGAITGATTQPDWAPPVLDRWRLAERRLMNPGSPGGEAWFLAFEPIDHAPQWAAGDIAEIGLPPLADGSDAGSREYSVASLPGDGRVELLVRLMTRPDGTPGLASGWLSRGLGVGDEVRLRVRPNRVFHGPSVQTPAILIGNGTGIAGLRSHIRARAGRGETWLMFGERTRAHDAFFDDELTAAGLARCDRVFSRDDGDGRYVQALIAEAADEVRAWVARGAVILVCGSLEGMSKGVHAALEDALGVEGLAALIEDGRYRRDVY